MVPLVLVFVLSVISALQMTVVFVRTCLATATSRCYNSNNINNCADNARNFYNQNQKHCAHFCDVATADYCIYNPLICFYDQSAASATARPHCVLMAADAPPSTFHADLALALTSTLADRGKTWLGGVLEAGWGLSWLA